MQTPPLALAAQIRHHTRLRDELTAQIAADEPALVAAEARLAPYDDACEAARADVGRALDACRRAGLLRDPSVTFGLVAEPGQAYREPTPPAEVERLRRALEAAKDAATEAGEARRPVAADARQIAQRLSQARAQHAYCIDQIEQLEGRQQAAVTWASRRQRSWLTSIRDGLTGA